MALNFPLSPTLNQQYTDPNGVVWVFDAIKWEVFRTDPSKLFLGTKLSLAVPYTLTSTAQVVSFSTESFDTANFFNPIIPTRITVDRSGFYRVNAQIVAGSGGSGASYTATIRKNTIFTLQTSLFASNQAVSYQEVLQLTAGDYIEIVAGESTGTGQLTTATFIEVSLIGFNAASQLGTYFSGAKARLNVDEAALLTPTAVNWDSVEFNINADILGNPYWSAGAPSRLTIYATAYYNFFAIITAGVLGGSGSYTLTLRKNGATNLDTIVCNPSDVITINSTYQLNQGDYVELILNNSGGVGSLSAGSYLQITRQGV